LITGRFQNTEISKIFHQMYHHFHQVFHQVSRSYFLLDLRTIPHLLKEISFDDTFDAFDGSDETE
jgi:hypothetical protein